MFSDSIIATIRTLVPLGAGWLVTQLALVGLVLPVGFETELTAAITTLAAAAYWAAVTWAAKRWPAIGWLLGHPASPSYNTPATPAPELEPLPDETRDEYRARSTR